MTDNLHRILDGHPMTASSKPKQRAFAIEVYGRLHLVKPTGIAEIESWTELKHDTVRKLLGAMRQLGLVANAGPIGHRKWVRTAVEPETIVRRSPPRRETRQEQLLRLAREDMLEGRM